MGVPKVMLRGRLKLSLGVIGKLFNNHETVLSARPSGASGTRFSPIRASFGGFREQRRGMSRLF